MALRALSLCAGVGGLDLALQGLGVVSVGYVERDAYAAAVLVGRMEEAALDRGPVWSDLGTFDARTWRGRVDIVAGGYPCQPFSVAGKRAGVDDPRHLWPHVHRIIDECGARLVVLENVPGHLSLGFGSVLRDLAASGFHAEWSVFSAAAVGAPHERERLFVLAYRDVDGLRELGRGGLLDGERTPCRNDAHGRERPAAGLAADALRLRHGRGLQLDGSGEGARGGSTEPLDPSSASGVAQGDPAGPGREGTNRREDARGRAAPAGSGSDVGDAMRAGSPHGGPRAHEGRAQPRSGSRGVAHPDGERRDEHGLHGRTEPRDVATGSRVRCEGCPPQAWPPGKDDVEGWERVAAVRPDLCPVEPKIRRMADGTPDRVDCDPWADRVRSCGNGVVPLQAENAIRLLARRALTEADEHTK